jgi:hypothetical protein
VTGPSDITARLSPTRDESSGSNRLLPGDVICPVFG